MRLFCCFFALSLLACQAKKSETQASEPLVSAEDDSQAEVPSRETAQQTKVDIPQIDYDTNVWFDLKDLDPSIQLDLRYATTNNFVKEVMYDCGRCFLRKEVARAVVRAHQDLREQGYGGLKMFDCYRPRPIQWKLWEKVPDPNYVADPRKGSMHNRGAAIDLTVVDYAGRELDMGTEFDFFGEEAHTDYTGHSDEIQQNRDLLNAVMAKQGLQGIRTEWWHFSYRSKSYEISDMLWNCKQN